MVKCYIRFLYKNDFRKLNNAGVIMEAYRPENVGNRGRIWKMKCTGCGLSSKIDPLFRLNLTHPNIFRVWVSFFIISDFYTVI